MNNKKLNYISLFQIAGPIFVILGHSLNGISNNGLWYIFTREWIYFFHMPLFFFISGYLLSFRGWLRNKSYKEFISNKFVRLLIPYFFWNLLFIVPKYIANSYLSDNVSLSFTYLVKAFVFPRLNIWGHTWFLVCLFLLFLFVPLWKYVFESLDKKRIFSFFVISILLYILPIDSMFMCLNDLHKEILFFGLGCFLGKVDINSLVCFFRKYSYLFLLGTVMTSIVCLYFYNYKFLHFIPAIFVLITLFCVFLLTNTEKLTNIITNAASYSFGIYILHWPLMIITRVVLFQILHFNAILVVIMMILLGWVGPVLLIRFIRRHFSKNRILQILIGV